MIRISSKKTMEICIQRPGQFQPLPTRAPYILPVHCHRLLRF
jgi:hypothetical protein